MLNKFYDQIDVCARVLGNVIDDDLCSKGDNPLNTEQWAAVFAAYKLLSEVILIEDLWRNKKS